MPSRPKEPAIRRLRAKLTYSNVISTLCLVLLVGGGTAYAAKAMLPKNSVGSKQIKKGAVTPAKLSKAAKSALVGPQGKEGTRGTTGPQGNPGSPGSAAGGNFALVSREGPRFLGEHPGFTAVSHPTAGVYCLVVQPGVSYYDPVASVEWNESNGFDLLVEPLGQEEPAVCPSGRLEVRTFSFEGAAPVPSDDVSFTVFLPQK